MLGRHHLLLSLTTYVSVFYPYFGGYPVSCLVAGLGVAIGSVLPDVDGDDAVIFHHRLGSGEDRLASYLASILRPLTVLFPYFAYPVKYLVYRPSVWTYDHLLPHDVAREHRGYTHSHLGVATLGIMTCAVLAGISSYFDVLFPWMLSVFSVGLIAGMYLHILEDSCTESGIAWNYPFSSTTLSGKLRTTSRPEDVRPVRFFLVTLAVVFVASVLLVRLYHVEIWLAMAENVLIVSGLWIIFVFGVSDATLN